jgi:hypothetical protein
MAYLARLALAALFARTNNIAATTARGRDRPSVKLSLATIISS